MVDKVMDLITDPEQMTTYSSAGADCRGGTGSGTDGKWQCKAFASRLPLADGFRKAIAANGKY